MDADESDEYLSCDEGANSQLEFACPTSIRKGDLSSVLFTNNLAPIKFNVSNCSNPAFLRAVIEYAGGMVVDANFDEAEGVIELADAIVESGRTAYSPTFVFDCIKDNELKSINNYVHKSANLSSNLLSNASETDFSAEETLKADLDLHEEAQPQAFVSTEPDEHQVDFSDLVKDLFSGQNTTQCIDLSEEETPNEVPEIAEKKQEQASDFQNKNSQSTNLEEQAVPSNVNEKNATVSKYFAQQPMASKTTSTAVHKNEATDQRAEQSSSAQQPHHQQKSSNDGNKDSSKTSATEKPSGNRIQVKQANAKRDPILLVPFKSVFSKSESDHDEQDEELLAAEGPRTVRRDQIQASRSSYTHQEDQKLLEAVVRKRLHRDAKGRAAWVELENSRIIDRTWQSMKERYLKRILPNIYRYDISYKDAKRCIDFHGFRPKEKEDLLRKCKALLKKTP